MEKFKPGNKTVEEFEDYEGFVEKFKPKKTTDDCYTPPAVYAAVLEWVKEEIGIPDGLEVIRPFYPGGNYQAENYADKVVIDNPPFSILSEIVRFYHARGIPFFLFAPRMTCLSGEKAGMENLTAVFGCKDITYENGANVPTAFLTNMMGDVKIRVSETLEAALKAAKAAKPSEKKSPAPFRLPRQPHQGGGSRAIRRAGNTPRRHAAGQRAGRAKAARQIRIRQRAAAFG
ncbi:TPA: hypothetical protein ACFORT_000323 [Neisseria meningitidis]